MGAGGAALLGGGAGLLGGLLIADAMTPDCGGGCGEHAQLFPVCPAASGRCRHAASSTPSAGLPPKPPNATHLQTWAAWTAAASERELRSQRGLHLERRNPPLEMGSTAGTGSPCTTVD